MRATVPYARTTLRPGKRDYLEKVRKQEEALRDKETPRLKRRLLFSVVLLLVLMYFSMGVVMWGWPAGPIEGMGPVIGLIEMLLSAAILYINREFFVSGFKSLMHGAPNMDTLVAMGSGVHMEHDSVC